MNYFVVRMSVLKKIFELTDLLCRKNTRFQLNALKRHGNKCIGNFCMEISKMKYLRNFQ